MATTLPPHESLTLSSTHARVKSGVLASTDVLCPENQTTMPCRLCRVAMHACALVEDLPWSRYRKTSEPKVRKVMHAVAVAEGPSKKKKTKNKRSIHGNPKGRETSSPSVSLTFDSEQNAKTLPKDPKNAMR